MTGVGGRCVVERYKIESMFGLPAGTKESGRCGEMALVEVRLYGQNSSTIVKIANLF